MASPRLYATFLLWLLSELFEKLPEVGDPPKPKLVFFFDEAHLLFNEAPKATAGQGRAGGAADPLQGRGRLFRHPKPARRAGQGSGPARQSRAARVAGLHAARSEGGEGRGRHVPAESRSSTPAQVITQLAKGEALVSFLEGDGTPSMVDRTIIRPPSARIGPVTPEERQAVIAKCPLKGKYDTPSIRIRPMRFCRIGSQQAADFRRRRAAAGCAGAGRRPGARACGLLSSDRSIGSATCSASAGRAARG